MQPTVWIAQTALAYCESESNRAHPNETGGVLMGWHRPQRHEITIVHAIGPGPHSAHEPYRYSPDADHHDEAVGEIYQRSGRLVTYLGDWHSHPRGSGVLSRTDRRTLGKIASHSPSRCLEPIMLVLGGLGDAGWSPAVHVWSPRRVLVWDRPDSLQLTLRAWSPEAGELDTIGYPYR